MRTLWSEPAAARLHPSLQGEVRADVAIVGAGIAGMTAAFLLQRRGARVAVIEAREVAGGESCHTSGHLTAVQDTAWSEIAARFGAERAGLLARAGRDAIDTVEDLCERLRIACDFARVPGHLFTESQGDLRRLEREARAASAAGFSVDLLDEAPLPFRTAGALRYADQAVFHPVRFVRGLAAAFVERGGQIFTRSRVLEVIDGRPCAVVAEQGRVVASQVIVATDAPISSRFLVHAKISPYRTYVVTAPISDPLAGLFWDMAEPYHYIRSYTAQQGELLLVGGEDHRVGAVVDTERCYDRLIAWTEPRFATSVQGGWSGQVNEPADGLPFIGRNALSFHVYVATGFSGTGLVNGVIAATMLSDELSGTDHPLRRALAATRVRPLAQAREVVVHNAETARWLVGDRIAPPSEVRSLEEVPAGQGRIVRLGKERLAVFRDDDGGLHALSPVCTHAGCYVHWNDGERSWDCPCHGSRFDTAGAVIHGPATRPLAARPLPEEELSAWPAEAAAGGERTAGTPASLPMEQERPSG